MRTCDVPVPQETMRHGRELLLCLSLVILLPLMSCSNSDDAQSERRRQRKQIAAEKQAEEELKQRDREAKAKIAEQEADRQFNALKLQHDATSLAETTVDASSPTFSAEVQLAFEKLSGRTLISRGRILDVYRTDGEYRLVFSLTEDNYQFYLSPSTWLLELAIDEESALSLLKAARPFHHSLYLLPIGGLRAACVFQPSGSTVLLNRQRELVLSDPINEEDKVTGTIQDDQKALLLIRGRCLEIRLDPMAD
jgi:hypothetical protein